MNTVIPKNKEKQSPKVEILDGVRIYNGSDVEALKKSDWSESKNIIERLYPSWRKR